MRWGLFFAGFSLTTICVSVGCTADDPVLGAGARPGQDAGTVESGSASDGGSLAPDAAPPAFCPLGCLPPAPSGWIGPSATFEGSEAAKPAACPAPYTQLVAEAHQGVAAGPAACACGAQSLTGAKCEADIELHSTIDCNTAVPLLAGTVSSDGPCLTITNSNGLTDHMIVGTPILTTRGTCSYPNPTKTLPAKTFENVKVACGLPQNAACEGRSDCVASPVPSAPFTRLCIHKDGDEPCPSQDYANRVLAFKAVSDTRDCAGCTGTPSGGACGGSYGFTSPAGACATTAPTTDAILTCRTNPGVGANVNGRALAPTGIVCTATGGGPTGEVTSTEPVTFCCNR